MTRLKLNTTQNRWTPSGYKPVTGDYLLKWIFKKKFNIVYVNFLADSKLLSLIPHFNWFYYLVSMFWLPVSVPLFIICDMLSNHLSLVGGTDSAVCSVHALLIQGQVTGTEFHIFSLCLHGFSSTFQKQASSWIGFTKLPLDDGIPSMVYSHLAPSVPRIDSGSVMTLTRIRFNEDEWMKLIYVGSDSYKIFLICNFVFHILICCFAKVLHTWLSHNRPGIIWCFHDHLYLLFVPMCMYSIYNPYIVHLTFKKILHLCFIHLLEYKILFCSLLI